MIIYILNLFIIQIFKVTRNKCRNICCIINVRFIKNRFKI